jgi:hypothetical protein
MEPSLSPSVGYQRGHSATPNHRGKDMSSMCVSCVTTIRVHPTQIRQLAMENYMTKLETSGDGHRLAVS